MGAQASEARAALSKKREELSETGKRIKELETKKTEGFDAAGAKKRLADLYARHDEIAKEAFMPRDTAEIDAEILAVSKKLAERKAGSYVSKYAKEIADAEARFEAAKKRYGDENAALSGIAPGVRCPACRQSVTKENLGDIKKSFGESINALIAEGNALKEEIAELKGLDAKAASVFDDFRREDIAKLSAEAGELEKKRDLALIEAKSDAQNRILRTDALKGEILSLESDLETGGLTEDESAELLALCDVKNRLAAEIGVTEAPEKSERADRKEKNIDGMRAALKEKKRLEAAVKCYIAERVKLRFADFGMLNRVSVMLCETVKSTGEIRDVFRLSYDGRPYAFLSCSEKIKAGLEISALLQRLTGTVYPVFIDNAESVPVIDNVKPAGQVFVARVAKGAPLSVKIADGAPPAEAAA